MQLDIFEHSRDVMLRNDVVHALEQRDAALARAACDKLAKDAPEDESLPALLALAEAIENRDRSAFRDHEALCRARRALLDQTTRVAQRIFGDAGAASWLDPLWQELAQRAAPLAFQADRSDDHAAPLWLRARNWKSAVNAVASIESWRRIPAPLAWMAEARMHLVGLHPTWPMLAELAWMSPRRFEEFSARTTDPVLQPLKRKFHAEFDGAGDTSDFAWFPAWVLTDRPDLADSLGAALLSQHSPPEQAMRILVELLGLERQGRHHDIVGQRKKLRDIHGALYAAYMKTR